MYWHWDYLITINGYKSFLKIVGHLISHYQQKELKDYDTMSVLQVPELVRIISARLSQVYISEFIYSTNQIEAETMFNLAIKYLYQLEYIVPDKNKYYCMLLEYNVVQNILQSLYYMKGTQTLLIAFSFISHLL